MTPEHIVNH